MSVSQCQQLELIWETEIENGDYFFHSSAFLQAYPHYMEAMIASDVLMEDGASSWKHILRVPEMYYTACTKMAHTYWSMKDIKNAEDYFLYCTYRLKVLTEKQYISDSLKQVASSYWLKALRTYAEFCQKTGLPMPPDMDKDDTYLQINKLRKLFNVRRENMN